MKKLIFRKFYKDLAIFLSTTLILMGLIVWTIQAVNYFDFVTQDGHGLRVYFIYSILNFPKIISRILPFIYFITIFYIILTYEIKNEIFLFWVNGISKIQLMHKILFFSFFIMILQILISGYLSPSSQFEARKNIKNSNIDFFTSLVKAGKFINITKGLTIFINEKKDDGSLVNIFLEEIKNKSVTRIIYAKTGELIENKKEKFLKLTNGKVMNIENSDINLFYFDEINFNLTNLTSKTITAPKLQELKTSDLVNCLFEIKKIEKNYFRCEERIKKQITQELLKRFYKPLFIPSVGLACCLLLFLSKNEKKFRAKINILFFLVFIILVLSEVSIAYIVNLEKYYSIFLLFPLILFSSIYLFFLSLNKNV